MSITQEFNIASFQIFFWIEKKKYFRKTYMKVEKLNEKRFLISMFFIIAYIVKIPKKIK